MNSKYPRDAFSKGQLASKSWLLGELYRVSPLQTNTTVALLGCWIGSLVDPLLNALIIERIYGIDIDADSIELAEMLNQKHVSNGWKFKGVVADVNLLETNHMQFETGGELIGVSPDIVINTSCEHMSNEWFETAGSKQLIVMQTNNSKEFDGHINVCYTIEEMSEKYPLSDIYYIGALKTPAYTRFMQIGFK
ncbi:uncharacterized protein METZ01_LOCUS305137 [marine metagenome]|uniref:Methyltransferase domain-containing protein n=1 Tax=marine metagenome TaxID=408172 RepID=A0A382MTG8_9ZZZZ